MNNVTVVVLAAGVGKRFWPFVTDKSMFPFLGEPIIVHNIRRLASHGFTRFLIVTNPANNKELTALSLPGVRIETVVQNDPKGMGDAILVAKDTLKGSPILVVNAEDMVEESLYTSVVGAIKKEAAFVVGKKTQEYFDSGYLKVSGNRLMGIVEKPGKGNEPSQLLNLVFHYFPRADEFISYMTRVSTSRDDQYEQALDRYVKDKSVSFLSYEGTWVPLKYPWHVLDVMDHFLHHGFSPYQGKHVEIYNNVSLVGPVAIGDNVKIFENTKIVGPVAIGDNTIIGSNNIIRESMIGAGCVTGFNSDIARSYIGDDCWFHTNYIGDSVLEGDIGMGSGSVLANLRLDEGEIASVIHKERFPTHKTKLGAMIGKHVRIGVNASIMPGVKIGSNSFVGAGVVLDRDLEEGSFCFTKPGYTIVKNTKHISSKGRNAYKAKL